MSKKQKVEAISEPWDSLEGWVVVGLSRIFHKVRCSRSHSGENSCLFFSKEQGVGDAHRRLWLTYAAHALKKGLDPDSIVEGLKFATGYAEYEGKELMFTAAEISAYEKGKLQTIKKAVVGTMAEIFPPLAPPMKHEEPSPPELEKQYASFKVEMELKCFGVGHTPDEGACDDIVYIAMDSMVRECEAEDSNVETFKILSINGHPAIARDADGAPLQAEEVQITS